MGKVSCKRDRVRRSFRRDRIQRLDNAIVDLSCLRVDLPSLSSFGVLEVLRRVQSDLNYVMEGFRMLGKGEVGAGLVCNSDSILKGEAEMVCDSGIEEGKGTDCIALPCVPVSGIQEEGKGQIA